MDKLNCLLMHKFICPDWAAKQSPYKKIEWMIGLDELKVLAQIDEVTRHMTDEQVIEYLKKKTRIVSILKAYQHLEQGAGSPEHETKGYTNVTDILKEIEG